MADFIAELRIIENDQDKTKEFTSNAASKDKRVFNLFNSNLKNLSTYIEYNTDLILSITDLTVDIHQKRGPLHKLLVDPKSCEIKYKHRSLLLENSKSVFTGTNNLARILLVFILSLNTKFYRPKEKAEYVWSMLPDFIWNNYNHFLNKMIKTLDSPIDNPLYMFFVLYSNKDLLDEYLQIIETRKLNDIEISAIKTSRVIEKRIEDCQIATFKYEALFTQIYRILSEIPKQEKTYEEVILEFVNKICNMLGELGGNTIKLFKFDDFYNGKVKDYFLDLDEEYKKIIADCIGCDIVSGKMVVVDSNVLNEKKDFVEDPDDVGHDEQRQCKVRKGQSKFKKRLIKRYPHKCLICDIFGIEHLRASHIISWRDSTPSQKVSSSNGFLMCPNHDFLFDAHVISFAKDGKIMIRKDFPLELYSLFNINSNIKITIDSDVEENLKEHRKIFEVMDV